jgi:hypothetical protein
LNFGSDVLNAKGFYAEVVEPMLKSDPFTGLDADENSLTKDHGQ